MKTKKSLFNTLYQNVKSSILFNTLYAISKNKVQFIIIGALDILFMLSLYLLNKLMTWLFPSISGGLSPNSTISLVIFSIILYYILTISAYSTIKFIILKKISRIFDKTSIEWTTIEKFILLNIIITLLLVIFFAIFSALFIYTINIDILKTIRDIFLVIFFTSSYFFINISHSAFIKEKKINATLGRTFDIFFTRPVYLLVFLSTAVVSAILIGAYYLIDFLVIKIAGDALNTSMSFTAYAIINTVIIAIIIICILSFNRIYLYNIIRRMKQ